MARTRATLEQQLTATAVGYLDHWMRLGLWALHPLGGYPPSFLKEERASSSKEDPPAAF